MEQSTIPALWLSRHTPTADQIADAQRLGYAISHVEDGIRLGSLDLKDEGDLKALITATLGLCAETGSRAIFGVIAAPVLAQMARTANDAVQLGEWSPFDIPVYVSWNVQRTVEGGKPTFAHRCWLLAGHLSQASTRWL